VSTLHDLVVRLVHVNFPIVPWISSGLRQLLDAMVLAGVPAGWAVILLTLGLHLVLIPVAFYLTRSKLLMLGVRGRIRSVHELYRGQPNAHAERDDHVYALYTDNRINPFAHVFAILVYAPVTIALLRTLTDPDVWKGASQEQLHMLGGLIGDVSRAAGDAGLVGGFIVIAMLASQVAATLTVVVGMTTWQRALSVVGTLWAGLFLAQFSMGVLFALATTFTWITAEFVVIRHFLESRTIVRFPAVPGLDDGAPASMPLALARSAVMFDPVDWARDRIHQRRAA